MDAFRPPDPDPAETIFDDILQALSMRRTVPELSWVAKRGACMPRKAFTQLLTHVKQDVEDFKSLLGGSWSSQFEVFIEVTHSDSLFSVTARRMGRQAIVRFKVDGVTVVAEYEPFRDALRGTPALDVDGRRKFRVGSELLEEWQFRMRALEELFFPTSP